MRFYTENEKKIKNYRFIINFWRRLVTILLYIKVVCIVSKNKLGALQWLLQGTILCF